MNFNPRFIRQFFASLALVACSAAVCGCSSGGSARITFSGDGKRVPVYQQFPAAYISSSKDGEYDIVLVSDVIGNAGEVRTDRKPLRPVTQPPVQQAMHIHVFWRPVQGAMVRESSITNAIIHWYVFGSAEGSTVNSLHYQGAGFVALSPGSQSASITIGDAQIQPKDSRGNMKDPVGTSRVTGSIIAVRNDARVKELLKTLQDQAAGNDRFWTGSALAQ